jgi:uncharacterized protein (TIGR02118 family)
MYKLVILIESAAGTATLDDNWPEFLRLAESMPGLTRETTTQVDRLLYGDYEIGLIHELFFDSLEDLQRAMASPQGQAAGQTLQKITRGRMSLLMAEHKEDSIENLRKYRTNNDDEAEPDSRTG